MPAGKRFLESLSFQHISQLSCQCPPVLQWELHPKHHNRCSTSGSSLTPNLGAKPPEDSEACSHAHFCAWNIVSLELKVPSPTRIPAKISRSVVCVSITRFTYILKLDLGPKAPDVTWNFVDTQIWTTVESHIGITCGELKLDPYHQYRF